MSEMQEEKEETSGCEIKKNRFAEWAFHLSFFTGLGAIIWPDILGFKNQCSHREK